MANSYFISLGLLSQVGETSCSGFKLKVHLTHYPLLDIHGYFPYIWSPLLPSSQHFLILQGPFRHKKAWIAHFLLSFFSPIFNGDTLKEINYILFADFTPSKQWVDIFMKLVIISLRPFFQVDVTCRKFTIRYGEGFFYRELFLSISVTLSLWAQVNGYQNGSQD